MAKTIGTQAPFELTSDETVAISSGENLLIGIRCDTVPACISVKTRETIPIQVSALPRGSDMQPGGNVVVVSNDYVAYVKSSQLICMSGIVGGKLWDFWTRRFTICG